MISFASLKPGDQGKICGFFPGDLVYRQKLLAMGLTPNTIFQVIRQAPLGDPVQIRVRQVDLCLRKSEAAILQIEKL
ncbi:MAG: ferrous iron transport protein A [uncultured bacterium]|nr:MAG: ferrous iron transport protein A [uncultured bacterium]OGT26162.1 MAG: iron transporter FeoA [Gammaproteobacteria bacterium RIFCSPHIGHO2_02_FULL_42_43]OGT28121.1 MAG: iron transporter FeoA [Gammaproteobacteria bacterium RIFCSPHIGHO2_01_FULL_42_8]OGT52540.1 MAG: iron transporter FeoA [Gammaproteobacteria bacterium RIFCSPHIGHO2_12_FULL_41_25]OGT63138.1 MAG: iron transporter FeoA [Gammaproteobacteria bacterium RIFCSPLOWO2_02_FULL_42_14]OGT86637.1 MAG: iron transporter FeoA [Gammaproteobac